MRGSGLLVLILLALTAVACGGTGGAPPSAPALSGQAALDAQATLAVWSAQGTVVAESTAVAVRATADASAAIAQATADAQATSVQATADTASAWATGTVVAAVATSNAAAVATANSAAIWDALAVQEKQNSINGTATAEADIAAFMRAEAAQALAERGAENDRRKMWTRLTPWLIGAVVAAVVGLIFLVVGGYVAERIRRITPQQAGANWILWHPEMPRVITQPQVALPRVEPRAALTTGATLTAAPVEALRPIPLPEIPRGHMLIAGETGSGKSTAAQVVAATRLRVRVLDPHWNGRDWAGHEVIGAGRDFPAIGAFMEEMRGLLSERYAARAGGRDEFEPLTVFVDEMPAIVSALGREVRDFWREWLREGRKVGLYLVLLTQSTRVRTLGIEGERDVLENFGAALVLGKLAAAEYPDLVAGMARPAVLNAPGGARAVVIPHVDMTTPAWPAPPQSNMPPAVYATTEWPTRREETVIDLNNLTERDKQRIADEFCHTLVIAQVQEKFFPTYGSDGGKAGRVIRLVLAEKGLLEHVVDDRGRPTWRPTAKALGLSAAD